MQPEVASGKRVSASSQFSYTQSCDHRRVITLNVPLCVLFSISLKLPVAYCCVLSIVSAWWTLRCAALHCTCMHAFARSHTCPSHCSPANVMCLSNNHLSLSPSLSLQSTAFFVKCVSVLRAVSVRLFANWSVQWSIWLCAWLHRPRLCRYFFFLFFSLLSFQSDDLNCRKSVRKRQQPSNKSNGKRSARSAYLTLNLVHYVSNTCSSLHQCMFDCASLFSFCLFISFLLSARCSVLNASCILLFECLKLNI